MHELQEGLLVLRLGVRAEAGLVLRAELDGGVLYAHIDEVRRAEGRVWCVVGVPDKGPVLVRHRSGKQVQEALAQGTVL